jgi:hypothetical protein
VTACREFEDGLRQNLADELGVDIVPGSVGGSLLLDSLLSKLVDVGMRLLDNCLNNNQFTDVMSAMFGQDLIRRMAINNALARSDIERKHRSVCRVALIKTVDSLGAAKMESVAKEIKSAPKVDWSLW